MDAQLRRGVLDVLALSAIKNEDSYGYKIIKDKGHIKSKSLVSNEIIVS